VLDFSVVHRIRQERLVSNDVASALGADVNAVVAGCENDRCVELVVRVAMIKGEDEAS